MLDSWVQEILEFLQSTSQLNSELMDDLARYDAFRLGFELDEDSSTPMTEQLQAHIESEDTLLEEEFEADDEAWRETVRSDFEKILDQTFGPEPPRPEHPDEAMADLFQDELKQEQQRAYEAYHETRNAARKDLLEEMLGDAAPDEEEEDFFDSDFDDENALSQSIKSIKTLKPHLEQRYDEHRFVNPLEALEALFGSPHAPG